MSHVLDGKLVRPLTMVVVSWYEVQRLPSGLAQPGTTLAPSELADANAEQKISRN